MAVFTNSSAMTNWMRAISFLPRKSSANGISTASPEADPSLFPSFMTANRTFWFVNFEQQKEPLGAATTIFVPTADQLRGDFSTLGRPIRDPLSNQNFPGNVIPASRLDPLAVNFSRQYVPLA